MPVESVWEGMGQEKVREEVVKDAVKRVQETATSALAGHAAALFLDHVMELIQQKKHVVDGVLNSTAPASTTKKTTLTSAAPVDADDAHLAVLLAKRKAVNLNNSEWERARELFTSVQRFLVALGATLAKDRRCRAAGATFPEKKKPFTPAPARHVRLYTIALAAAQGRYLSLDQFQGAITRAVGAISKAAEEEERTGREFLHDAAVALSCAIQDKVASACHALRTSLELDDPVNVRLLRAATGFAADVALVYQQKEADAVATFMAAAEAAAAAAEEEEGEDVEEQNAEDMIVEGIEDRSPAVQEQGDKETVAVAAVAPTPAATTPAPLPAPANELEHEEEQNLIDEPPKQSEEVLAAPVPATSAPPLAAAVHRAAMQIKTDLLERVQFTTNYAISGLNAQSFTKEDYSGVWHAVNEALPVLVAKGMAACDAAVEACVLTASAVGDEDEVAGLCEAFVDTLINNLNE